MAALHLNSITCFEQEDTWGDDDAYIKIDGNRVWGPYDMDDDQSRPVDVWHNFTTSALVELMEEDDIDNADRLGEFTATTAQVGAGEQHAYMTYDDASYRIDYEVLA